ncbi:MAG: TAT-variant-translocated molybdopterin oxidoreductase [Chthoniobacterales bacterium]|nr:TAT-variant-translocated molybdopterin oxidoreductase [Chthoniobacterales bacterium]
MKRILPHPERPAKPVLWRSLDELAAKPEFDEILEREFPQGAAEWQGGEMSRRNFLQLMGASMALAGIGMAGCRRPEAYIVPFTQGVEWTIPGKFLYYATAQPRRNGAMPLVAATSSGRPTKLEGNPLHPISNGATDTFAQAAVLDLYDPTRSRAVKREGTTADAADFAAKLEEIRAAAEANGGEGLAFLVERNDSPTRDRLLALLQSRFPRLMWAEYEPLGAAEAEAATAACFGPGTALAPDFNQADKVLAVDCDFLNASFSGIDQVRGFTARRRISEPGQPMNRLYVAETRYTGTGGMADHRLRIKPSEAGPLLRALGREVAALTGDSDLAAVAVAFPDSALSSDPQWIVECAKDLAASRGRSLVVVGDGQPVSVQVLALAINKALGSFGRTLRGMKVQRPAASSITELAAAMEAGRVQNLFILGGNPVYNAPADLRFGDLLGGISTTVRLGLHEDETSAACRWHVPQAHFLESWGDTRSADGTICAVQPMILPLWDGVSELEILNRLAGNPEPVGPQLVRETFAGIAKGADLEAAWTEFLRKGFLADTAWPGAPLNFNTGAAEGLASAHRMPAGDGFEVAFTPSSTIDDGRYATNGWLQETPDFATKITWDNAVLVSPVTAKSLGLADGDMVKISAGDTSIKAAAIVAPGHADGALSISLGYGRTTIAGAASEAGFNAYPLRTTKGMAFVSNASLRRTGDKYKFSETQTHQSMEGRDLVREATLSRYDEDPTFAQTMGMDGHIPPNISLFTHPKLDSPEQWGMAVDLSTCVGCNACVVACQAENNIPIVGKDQVGRGRIMAWIRMDRYFAGDEEDPEMLAQAIMCQHCENAPCETVCPVNATVHSEDGLNLMAYNRCIGTRYCANNCPWKVRRFNFFDYNQRPLDQLYFGPLAKKGMAESLQMSKNPNVTVRMRGVMEKCTYCIQRIEEAKITRSVKAGASDKSLVPFPEVKSACQQACPSESIVFGDIRNPDSRVAKLKAEPRNYQMLKYLNVSPRTTYLARIKNPNMAMPGADKVGWANGHPHHGGGHGAGHEPAHGAEHATEAHGH